MTVSHKLAAIFLKCGQNTIVIDCTYAAAYSKASHSPIHLHIHQEGR